MTTAVIVQARVGSTRLPGKVLRRLAGKTVLHHVLERCRAIPGIDVVCCATTTKPEDGPVVDEATNAGAETFRGSERDVLDRYHRAAVACHADIVVRVTSDCPLIDPAVCGEVIALRKRKNADYACNNMPPGWPHGLDCEVFTAAGLARAAAEATTPDEREHVTPWLRAHPNIRRANLAGPGGDLPTMRWTLDYSEDLAFLSALFGLLPAPPEIAGVEEVAALLRANPQIAAINANRHQKICV